LTNCKDRVGIVIFSDHSQVEYVSHIDILAIFDRYGIKIPDDIIPFVDATLAIIYVQKENIMEKLISVFSKIPTVRIITRENAHAFALDFPNRMYGDLFVILKPGYTFIPNFYSRTPMQGLHGYLPKDSVQKGYIIGNSNLVQDLDHVRDIKKLLVDLMPMTLVY